MLMTTSELGQLGDVLAELVDVGALLADDDAGARRMDRHAALLVRTLDDDLRDRRLLERLHQGLADRHVLVQQLAVFALAGEPARIPGAVDAEAQPDRIDFLTHRLSPQAFGFAATSRTTIVRLEKGFSMRPARPRARGREALHHQRLADIGLGDDEIVDVELVIVLGVGDRALERLLHVARDALAGELADRRAPSSTFLPRISCATRLSFCGETRSMRATAFASLSASRRGLACFDMPCLSLSSPSCPPRGRGRSASARTRRTCGRPCPRTR